MTGDLAVNFIWNFITLMAGLVVPTLLVLLVIKIIRIARGIL